jgi:hypothetical protein
MTGMDPCVYDMMKNLRAAKAAQALGVTVKSEAGSDTPRGGATTRAVALGPCGQACLPHPLKLASVKQSKAVRLKTAPAARRCFPSIRDESDDGVESVMDQAPDTGPRPSRNGPIRHPTS